MAKLLAIDTSTIACSAALMLGEEITEKFVIAPMEHGQRILPMIQSLLSEGGIALSELDAIAFGRGPGSFTGVRIAASVVQGLAFAYDKPVIAVSTLEAMAYGAFRQHLAQHVLVALDARMQEVYWGVYAIASADSGLPLLHTLAKEQVIPPNFVKISEQKGEWIGIGDGWASYEVELKQSLFPVEVKQIFSAEYPRAWDIVVLAKLAWKEGRVLKAADALPIYLRDNVAEVKNGQKTT